MFINSNKYFLLTLTTALFLAGCRGQPSQKPPIMLQQNMAEQTVYGPQEKNTFFKDGKASRPKIAGTIAHKKECTDSKLCQGLEPESSKEKEVFVKSYPLKVTKELLERGKDRFYIYCAPCHGYSGDSNGLVTQAAGGAIRPTQFHDGKVLEMPLGEIYKAVALGVNNMNMPGFSYELDVKDRWAVVAYVDALRKSRRVTLEQIPENIKEKNGWSKK
ncbi:MAG: cytochrome c [Silvanigrellaceae bacterium]|nr:cytochrome c [Silvanigrellaceae bacterium]